MGETTAPPAGTTVTKLSGLGDGAYFQSTSTSFDVWVLKGQVMLDVSATPTQAQMGNAGLEGLMVAAARTAVKGM